jgi:error-prone DNA polymerase
LERTLGVPIFQEQVMQLAIVAAGFSAGEADQLRRSMAAWRRTGKLQHFRERLHNGMTSRGYSAEFAAQIFAQIEGFSEYGFPESHAASFALLAYASAWLKCHEPAAFCCALLNSLPMGFYTASQLIQDVKRHQVRVLPVDAQVSQWLCTLEDIGEAQPAIRLGMVMINGLGLEAGERVAGCRPAEGYQSTEDLQQRSQLSARDLGVLAKANALTSLAGNRSQAWWQVRGLDAGVGLTAGAVSLDATPDLPALSAGETVKADYASLGLTLGPHPMSLLRARLTARRLLSAREIQQMPNGRPARCAGLVVTRQRPGHGQRRGVCDAGRRNRQYQRDHLVRSGRATAARIIECPAIGVYGVVQRQGQVVHLLAKRLVDLTSGRGNWIRRAGILGKANR